MPHRFERQRGGAARRFILTGVLAIIVAMLWNIGPNNKAAADNPPATDNDSPAKLRRNLNNLKQLALALHNFHDAKGHLPPAVVMGPDGKTPHSWRIEMLPFLEQETLYRAYRMNEPWDSPHNKKLIGLMPDSFRSPYDDPKSTNSGYFALVGPGTVFEGPDGISFRDISDGSSNTIMLVEARRNIPWTKPEDIPFDPDQPLPSLGGFVQRQFAAVMADGLARRFDYQQLKSRLRWLITRNDGHAVRLPLEAMPRRQRFQSAVPAEAGVERQVFVQERLAAQDVPQGPYDATPQRRAPAGDKAGRSEANLKALAQAMQNYLATNGHFPPAVIIGPDGKTPHSWRVELLPYLDHKPFRDPYHMGEPWDSPHNKKVLEQIPDVFRSPYDDLKSTNSGYYVFVGPGSIFDGKAGIKREQITDDTSATLLIVESKHNVPWTKPEDIPFEPGSPLPELGGFVPGRFAAAMDDGVTRTFDSAKAKDQLPWLIVRNDGHQIDWEKIGSERGSVTTHINVSVRRRFSVARRPFDDVNHLRQLALAVHNYHDVHGHFPPAAVMGPDGKTPHSWRVELLPFLEQQGLYRQYRMNEPWDSPRNLKVLAQMPDVFHSSGDAPDSPNSGFFALVGRGTAFEGHNGIRISDIVDGTSNTLMFVEAKRNIPWTKPEDIPFDPDKPLPQLGGFVRGQFSAAMCDGSVRVFQDAVVKDKLKLLIMRNDMQAINLDAAPERVVRRNPVVRRRVVVPGDKAGFTRRNLKQLLLAMHNYHDIHRHFPPAVSIGPDGKTPHSWRVDILPMLEMPALYEQYRLNEPWDSPNNKKVLAQIPDVFRSPYDDPNSTNSGYFALVGPGTVFEGKKGVRIRDITDGTSNTLMLVEAKRNIPWTKPEDIPFDPDKPVPKLGGFVEGQFMGAMCDGSVRRFDAKEVKGQFLKWLIIYNDGNAISVP